MKNKSKNYAKALAEIILAGKASEKKIVDGFLKLLEKDGQQRHANEILDLTEEIILAAKGKKKIYFETARQMTAKQKKMLDSVAKPGDVVKEKINPELIAGIKIIINNNRELDASLQNKLNNIF